MNTVTRIEPTSRIAAVGAWFLRKWRGRLADADASTVARQMRKAGIPLEVARFVLLGRHE